MTANSIVSIVRCIRIDTPTTDPPSGTKKTMAPLPGTPQSTALLQLITLNRMPPIATMNENLVLSQSILKLLFPKIDFNFLDENPQKFDFERFKKIIYYLRSRNPSNLNLIEVCDMYRDGETIQMSPTIEIEPVVGTEALGEEVLGAEFKIILPSKQEALKLIYTTRNEACVLPLLP